MRYIFLSILLFLLGGCSLKLTQDVLKEQYYLLEYNDNNKCEKTAEKTAFFIDFIKASSEIDTRFINLKDGYKFDKFNGYKFAALPSEMVRKAVFKSFYSNCDIEPKFVMKDGYLIFKSEILALYIDKKTNVAVFEMMYSVDKETKSLFSGVKKSEVKISANDKIGSINKAMNLTINSILSDIKEHLIEVKVAK